MHFNMFIFGLLAGSAMLIVVDGSFTCPNSGGIFPDPDDCTKYIMCAQGNIAYYFQCGPGTYFSDVHDVCEMPASVDCGSRPIPGQTTNRQVKTTPSFPETTPEKLATTTTSRVLPPSVVPGGGALPRKVVGLYVLLADDTVPGFTSTSNSWTPQLYDWQQQAGNVLFFSFINPTNMAVPPAFQKLAASRGTGASGAVPAGTKIMFSVGGYSYSLNPNPWPWLVSQAAAEAMAAEVAQWPKNYGCDGIDLDIEDGAGATDTAGQNLVYFIRRLKQLNPQMIVTQPTFGFPQIAAEIDVINNSWNRDGSSTGLADAIGIMVYSGTQSLQYVKNFAQATSQWQGFPIHVDVPSSVILLGALGSSPSSTIEALAQASIDQDLMGIMVWFASVKNGFSYVPSDDASSSSDSQSGYIKAMTMLKPYL